MKKTTLLIFVIISLCASLLPAFASGYEETETTYLEILHEIGLMEDDLFSELSRTATMTRADYIQILMSIMTDDTYEHSNSPFVDVLPADKAFNSICSGYEHGIVSGDENKCFNPSAEITYNAAVKFSVSALGYDKAADYYGGYPNGYLKVASQTGITKGVQSKNGTLMPESAAKLLYNTMMTDVNGIVELSNKNGGYVIGPVEGESLIWAKKKIKMTSGILKRNSFTSLSDTDNVTQNEILIGDFSGYYYHTTAAEDYLGYEVDCYYRVNDDNENIVVAIFPTDNNSVVKISAKEFIEVDNNEIYYTKNDSDKNKSVEFSGVTMVIYNGKAKPDYTIDDFDISAGDIVVIDNNQDDVADVINIHSYNDYLIYGLDNNKFIVFDKYKKSLDLSTEDGESVIITDYEGNILSFDELQNNMVLTAMVNDGYVRAIAYSSTVKGTVDQVYNEDGDTYIVVDGVKYFLSADYPLEKISEFEIGKKANVLINVFGHIAGIDTAPEMWKYGYIIKTYFDSDTERLGVKIMDVYGVIYKYNLAEKFKIDGERYNSVEGNLLNIPLNNIVIFELNNVSEIKSLETTAGRKLHATAEKTSLTFNGSSMWFDGFLPITTTTPVFVCPPASAANAKDEDYFVTTSTYLAALSYVVQGFNTDKDSYIPDIILVEPNTTTKPIKWNSPNLIVKNCEYILNRDGEETVKISGYDFTANEISYELKNKNVISGIDINSGDVIKFKTDDSGLVEVLDKSYDAERGIVPSTSIYSSASIRASYRPFAAYVYEKSDVMIGLAQGQGKKESGEVYYYQYAGANVLIAEEGRNGRYKVREADFNILSDYVNNGIQSRVFAYTSDGKLKTIVVYI